jgi:hypothetical protein
MRSSSIVMTLPNGLGVVSVMAALLSLTWFRLATSSSARFGGRQPYLFVRKIPCVILFLLLGAAKCAATTVIPEIMTGLPLLRERMEPIQLGLVSPLNGVGGDLITELDALTEFSAKASVALSLQPRND